MDALVRGFIRPQIWHRCRRENASTARKRRVKEGRQTATTAGPKFRKMPFVRRAGTSGHFLLRTPKVTARRPTGDSSVDRIVRLHFMKKVRYRFKSKKIKVMRVAEIMKTPQHKLPKWIQEGLGKGKKPRVLWLTDKSLHYWTRYGECTLELGPKDWLINIPPLDSMPKDAWEITGYLNENFRKKIERF